MGISRGAEVEEGGMLVRIGRIARDERMKEWRQVDWLYCFVV